MPGFAGAAVYAAVKIQLTAKGFGRKSTLLPGN